MGEANRKRKLQSEKVDTPTSDNYIRGVIDLHMLPPVPEVNGARIFQLTGDATFSKETAIILRAFRSFVGSRNFLGGFCVGDGERFSPVVTRLASLLDS